MSDNWIIDVTSRRMECSTNLAHQEMKRGLDTLATVGSTAPFVGLLGTVIGIVNAFTGIAMERHAAMALIARGIAEALITTSLGLCVAVPAVWAYNYFASRLECFDLEMKNSADELVTCLGYLRATKLRTRS